jgi:hypothetical protein
VTTTPPAPPWVIIADYPRWPSLYFAHLERHAAGLPLAFRPGLGDLDPAWQPGVVNLHRLKRLYRDPGTGTATMAAAESFLARLAALKEEGWRVAWTVHGLLPVDGPPPGPADHAATAGVLELADAVLCHTRADASALEGRTKARTWVAGWSCLDPPAAPALEITALAAQMRRRPLTFLLLGNLTAYKDAPAVAAMFLRRTGFAVPVIAPALPAIEEITGGQLRWLARPGTPAALGDALAAAESRLLDLADCGDPRDDRPAAVSTDRGRQAAATYRQAARWLARRRAAAPARRG